MILLNHRRVLGCCHYPSDAVDQEGMVMKGVLISCLQVVGCLDER